MSSRDATTSPRRGGPLRTAIVVVGVLALLASVAAGWYGVAWYRAAHDESIELAQTREAVLRDARQAAINLNTLDYASLEEDFDLWEQSATGTVLSELESNREAYASTLAAARTSSTAEVVESAVADLSMQAGTARVLVGVDVTYRPEQGQPSCVLQRLVLEMKRVGNGWKVEQLAPVGASTPNPGPCVGASSDDGQPN